MSPLDCCRVLLSLSLSLFEYVWHLQCSCICVCVCWAETLEWRGTGWQQLLRSRHGYRRPGNNVELRSLRCVLKDWVDFPRSTYMYMLTHTHTHTHTIHWWLSSNQIHSWFIIESCFLGAAVIRHWISCVRQEAVRWSRGNVSVAFFF